MRFGRYFLTFITVTLVSVLSVFYLKAYATTYYDSGYFVSTNMLDGLGAFSIDDFGYNASSAPANTSLQVQFSQDGTSWYDSAGTESAWDTLSQGDYSAQVDALDLSALDWSSGYFYYKMQFQTSDPSITPVVDDVVVYYTSGSSVGTDEASEILVNWATGNGEIEVLEGGNATVRGFKYGETQTDTWDVNESGSFGTGPYNLILTGLATDTTYYYRSYATNGSGTSYGPWVDFTTGAYYDSGSFASTNLLDGLGVTDILSFGYNASSAPAGTSLQVQFSQDGVDWYDSSGQADGWETLSEGNFLDEGDALDLSALSWSSGFFYYQVQMQTSDPAVSPLLDEVVVFYTGGSSVSTQDATDVKVNTATGNGNIEVLDGGNATARGFKYGLTQTDTWDAHEEGDFSTGAYTVALTGLEAETTYYIRSYATTSSGTSYGNWESFTTAAFYGSGSFTSTNLLEGQTVESINTFTYTLSSKPAGTEAVVQFSHDGETWYSSAGEEDGSDTLSAGTNDIDLEDLEWIGANFYYQVTLTASAEGGDSPVLTGISLTINADPVAETTFKGGTTIKGCTVISGKVAGDYPECPWALSESTCNELDGWYWYSTNGREACWSKTLADNVSWNKGVGNDTDNPGAYTCATDVTFLKDRMIAVAAGEWYKIVSNVSGTNITSSHNGSSGYSVISALAISDCIDGTRDLCTGDGCLGGDLATVNTSLATWASATGSKAGLPYCADSRCGSAVNSDYRSACEQNPDYDYPLNCSLSNVFYMNQKVCNNGDINYTWAAAADSTASARKLGFNRCSYVSGNLTSFTASSNGFRAVLRP